MSVLILLVIVGIVGSIFVVNFNKGRRDPAALTRAVSQDTGQIVDGRYFVNGRALACTVCKHDVFNQRSAQLNTAGATLFGLDWANESARCLVCKSCGYVHWFIT